MHNVTVTIEPNRMGDYIITAPTKFVAQWRGKTYDNDESLTNGAYIQQGFGTRQVEESVSTYARRQLHKGYSVKVRIYDEIVLAWFQCAS